ILAGGRHAAPALAPRCLHPAARLDPDPHVGGLSRAGIPVWDGVGDPAAPRGRPRGARRVVPLAGRVRRPRGERGHGTRSPRPGPGPQPRGEAPPRGVVPRGRGNLTTARSTTAARSTWRA